MKKKSIKKLSLKKSAVANFNPDAVKGGTDTVQSVYICESENWCMIWRMQMCQAGSGIAAAVADEDAGLRKQRRTMRRGIQQTKELPQSKMALQGV